MTLLSTTAALAAPLKASAQQSAKVPRIGFLGNSNATRPE
jgi:hypothetical protein